MGKQNNVSPQGNGGSKLVQLIRELGQSDSGRLELATVIAPAPALSIRVVNMMIDLDGGDVVVSECLTDHTGVIVRPDGIRETLTYEDALKAGDRVIVSSMSGGQTYAVLDRVVTGT